MPINKYVACCLVSLLACGRSPARTEEVARLNVVLVVVDSLRADHLGLYGYAAPTSPFLDSLDADAVIFERAWAPSSYTSQSVAAILTGRLPSSGGSTGLLEAEPSPAAVSLQRHFRRAGRRTGVVSSQPLLRRRAFTSGFEDIQVAGLDESWAATEVTRRALDSLDTIGDESFFFYLHYSDPHQPYAPPADLLTRFTDGDGGDPAGIDVPEMQAAIERGDVTADDARVDALTAAYDAEIAAVDRGLEELFAGLEQRDLLAETLVVITASQGEELLDHGWWGHAWTLFEEVLHVPLLLIGPGLAPGRVTEPVSLVDLGPSLLIAAGLDAQAVASDGDPFLRRSDEGFQVRAAGRAKIAELVIRERCIHRAVLAGTWKYIATTLDCPPGERRAIAADYPNRLRAAADGSVASPDEWAPPRRELVFDLAGDPSETSDLSAEAPERLAELRRVLDNYAVHVREHGLAGTAAMAPADLIDPDQAERLESLGYL